MRLIRQFWLALFALAVISVSVNLLFNGALNKRQLESQLLIRNTELAQTLALSVSQLESAPPSLERTMSAFFAAGSYRMMQVIALDGSLLLSHQRAQQPSGVPAWFVAKINLQAPAGQARLEHHGRALGQLKIQSSHEQAYAQLWSTLRHQSALLCGVFLLLGLLGHAALRSMRREVDLLVDQADAIAGSQFASLNESNSWLFSELVQSMNQLSEKISQTLGEETGRLAELRRKSVIDPITGLLTRDYFFRSLNAARADLARDHHGILVLLRITNLADLNRQLGKNKADIRLRQFADHLHNACQGHSHRWVCGRIGGSDFAVLAMGEPDIATVAEVICNDHKLFKESASSQLCAGAVHLIEGEERSKLMARADAALALAEQQGGWVNGSDSDAQAETLVDWRARLEPAISASTLKLAKFAVRDAQQKLLHVEAPVRLLLNDEWVPAAGFSGWIGRLKLSARLDLLVLEKALASADSQQIAVHISAESLAAPQFTEDCLNLLQASPEAAQRLWLEVPELGGLRQVAQLRSWIMALREHVGHIGLKHAGHELQHLTEFGDAGLDHIKLDAAFSQDLGAEQRELLKNLCTLAQSIGVMVIATGIDDENNIAKLFEMGVAGVTGPAVLALEQALPEAETEQTPD